MNNPMTEPEKTEAAAHLATGLTANAVAKKMKRDPKTIRSLAAKPETQLQVQDFQSRLVAKLEAKAEEILDGITPEDVEKATLQQKCVSFGVLVDKQRLISGQSTSNVSVLFQVTDAAEGIRRGAVIDVNPGEEIEE